MKSTICENGRSSNSRALRTRSARAGFTVLEIVIASAILFIGILGVLSLFPAGIATGRKVVEDSTAIAVARSVADAIRAGMRNHLRYRTDQEGAAFTYFIFNHDGVKAPIPADESKEDPRADYFILLPRHRPGATFGGHPEESRREAIQAGKTFVYPESDPDPDPSTMPNTLPNGGGNPFQADNDGDDAIVEGGYRTIRVREVYQLGSTLPGAKDKGPTVLDDQKDEVLKQYSYAFEIRQSFFDTDLLQRGMNAFKPGNELYHFRVMVFRAFKENYRDPRGVSDPGRMVEPVFELEFEVAR